MTRCNECGHSDCCGPLRENDVDALQARIAELELRIHEAQEVYAGMEGFVPETAPEGYCLRIIDEMNKALLGGGRDI